ncbi:hypothetical protein C8J56DRAFT_895510 [Mycena floridula]|nr:hypothetical protein C8J56DRAFT_895510 [Mycena floridula]
MSSKTKTNNAPYSHVAYYDAWCQTHFLKHSDKTECNGIEMAWANKSRDRYQGEGCKNLWDCTAVQNEFDLSKGERIDFFLVKSCFHASNFWTELTHPVNASIRCQHFHQIHREARCAGARLYYKTTLKERHQQKKIQSCSDDKDSVCRFYPSHEVSEVTKDLSTLEEEVENWKHLLGKDFWKPGKECWKSLHGILTETEI